MRRATILLALLALLGGSLWLWRGAAAQAEDPPATVAVARGDLVRTVLATGMIEAEDLVSVGARTSGQIERLAVAIGDTVAAGALIAQIDSEAQQNAVAQAEADLAEVAAQIEAQEASITEARLARERVETLAGKKLNSTADLEAAEAALAVARATAAALRAQKDRAALAVTSAKLDLARTTITAPISGTVVAIVNSEGQTVNATQEAPTIVKLARLERMVIKADISEADVIDVAPGQSVTFTLLGAPERSFTATLGAVEPAPAAIEDSDEIDDESAIYYRARFTVENPEGLLRIGMTAEVTITLEERKDVLWLPAATLGGQTGRLSVMVWSDGAQTAREIETGLATGTEVEIVSGLREGEQVVASSGSGASAAVARRSPAGMMF